MAMSKGTKALLLIGGVGTVVYFLTKKKPGAKPEQIISPTVRPPVYSASGAVIPARAIPMRKRAQADYEAAQKRAAARKAAQTVAFVTRGLSECQPNVRWKNRIR